MHNPDVLRAYRFCLDPTQAQRNTFSRYCGAARWGFNYRLAELIAGHRRWAQEVAFTTYEQALDVDAAKAYVKAKVNTVRSMSLAEQGRQLTDLVRDHRARAAVNPHDQAAWLHVINRHVIVAGMRNADQAWSNWIESSRGERAGTPMGYPRFKKKGCARESFSIYHNVKKPSIRLETYRRLRIPSIGEVRLHGSGKRLARAVARGSSLIQSVTVSRCGHRWYASVLVKEQCGLPEPSHRQHMAGIVGACLGPRGTVTLSTGAVVPPPRIRRARAIRIAKLQAALSRSSNGSKRRHKLTVCLEHLEHLQALDRDRQTHALTKRLATNWEAVAIEGLYEPTKSRPVSQPPLGSFSIQSAPPRPALDVQPSELCRQLAYKTSRYGSELHVLPRRLLTCKTCSCCGWVKPKLNPQERMFHCEQCGLALDGDLNAARNIAALVAVPAESRDEKAHGDPVREPLGQGRDTELQKCEDHPGGHRPGAIPDPS